MPIKARIDMLTTGVRTPLGIKVLGSDHREASVTDMPGKVVGMYSSVPSSSCGINPEPSLKNIGTVSTWQWQIDSLTSSSNTVQNGSSREPSDTISPQAELCLIWRIPSLYPTDFRREHVRGLSSGVTTLPENDRVRESGFPELAQEGNSFLRTGNSRKPICFTGSGFGWQEARKDQFRCKHRSTAPDYPRKLPEDSVSRGVQIKDAVD